MTSSVNDAKKEPKDTRKRVKLYVLNENRSWDDRGTGHVTCAFNENQGGVALTVRSEVDGSPLLESRVLLDTVYQKQQETLIVWSEGENCDLALSFQEKAGCDDIWARICQIQGKDPTLDVTQDAGYDGESDGGSPDTTPAIAGGGQVSLMVQLPPCELSRLNEINDLIASCLGSPLRRENLATAIENEDYISKLLELFRMCEDLENIEALHTLYRIFKSIFMLNKNALFDILFAEENLKGVVGVLEYDPAAPPGSRRHREYLWEQASFKEVIPIDSPELKAKIHQTYRVQYIQDIILPAPSIFEENLLSTLSSFIFFNKVEIVSLIQDDDQFLSELFKQLSSKSSSVERNRDLSLFLKDFCSFSQTLQPQSRESFFKTLMSHGILSAIESSISSEDDQTRLAVIEIFSHVVDFNAALVREHALEQRSRLLDDSKLFFNIVIGQMCQDKDPELGAAMQLAGILKILIDPESMMSSAQNKTEKNEFLQFFYKRCMPRLCTPLVENTEGNKPAKDDYRTANMLSLLLDLLSFCIEHHSYHVRSFIINKDLLKRILVLLKSRHAFLSLSALRLFRRIVQLKDEFYNRHIVKQRLLEPIVECFCLNGHKYNLMNSALLELFEFMRLEEIKTLYTDLVERHIDQFKDVDYVQTFHGLKLRYEQHQERLRISSDASSPSIYLPASRRGEQIRELDEEEEQWFNEEDEDEWNGAAATITTSPVLSPGSIASKTVSSPLMSRQPRFSRDSPSSATPAYLLNNSSPRPKSTPTTWEEDPRTGVKSQDKENTFGERGTGKPMSVRSHKITIKLPSSPTSNGSGSLSPTVAERCCSPSASSSSPSEASSSSSTPTSGSSSSPARKGLVDYDYGDSDDDEESSEMPGEICCRRSTATTSNDSASPTSSCDSTTTNAVVNSGEDASEPQEPAQKRARLEQISSASD